MSLYGKMAHVGTFDPKFDRSSQSPIRSNPLLHIATARGDLNQIALHVRNGIPVDLLAKDGLAPLHWSLASESTQPMKRLLELGANPDARSITGATTMMSAVQTDRVHHLNFLISSGADVNAHDHRGFTALHRAAEMGRVEIVKILLNNGANPHFEAEGYTPMALAEMREENEIVGLLRGSV